MVKISVLYGQPTDPAAFEKHYAEVHLPLAAKMKGIHRMELARGIPGPDGAKPAFYRTSDVWFETAEQLEHALTSAEGQAAAADLKNFATGGATLLLSSVEG